MQICCCVVTSLGLRSPSALPLRRATTRRLGSSVALPALKVRIDKFQQVVDQCNYIPATASKLVPLTVAGVTAGEVFVETAELLAGFPDVFRYDRGAGDGGAVTLAPLLEAASPDARTAAVATVAAALRASGAVTGWRDELVAVAPAFGAPPLFCMERAAYPLLGIAGYGVHVNGFVKDPAAPGGLRLWVATRSFQKPTWPGLRDHLVAGQISGGLGPTATVVKECGEEAGISEALAARAAPAGAVSYRGVDEAGRLKRDVLFVFDLELPFDFVPTPVDGEVEGFELWDLARVCQLVEATADYGANNLKPTVKGLKPSAEVEGEAETPYKPNVALVVVDFLIRQGVLCPDDPGYLPLLASLRSGTCA